MKNPESHRDDLGTPGANVKKFLAWLRGLWSPRYVPQKSWMVCK